MKPIGILIPMIFCVAGLLLGPENRRLELIILISALLICMAIIMRKDAA